MSDATRPPRPQAPFHGNGETSTNRALTITTETIQKYLEENHALIKAIIDATGRNQMEECARYQQKLQQNLMHLAAIADSQPQPAVNTTQQGAIPSRIVSDSSTSLQ